MPWTKLESASILFKGEEKVKWALFWINNNAYESHSTFSSWSSPYNESTKEKNFGETHGTIFGVFSFSEGSEIKKKMKNEKNYLHGKTPNKQKKKREIFLGFLLLL